MFLIGTETQNWTLEHMENEVNDGIQNVLQHVFELSAIEGITTEAAARQVAEKRLSSVK
jgi:glutamate dehydrogenase/leucine dehydrogenase